MKKTLCLLLTALMVLGSFGIVTAGAENYDKVVYAYATFNNIPTAEVLDTIEEKILALQEAKKDLADAILSGESSSLFSLSHEELLALLE